MRFASVRASYTRHSLTLHDCSFSPQIFDLRGPLSTTTYLSGPYTYFLLNEAATYPPVPYDKVLSAAAVLTVVFGMGTGVAPPRIATSNIPGS